MANFRTTPDLLDEVLRTCGEITSDVGISPRTSAALLYLNRVYLGLVQGGNELEIDCDEPWLWARSRRPIILQMNPAITTLSVAATYGSASATLSGIPQLNSANVSIQGWHIKLNSGPELYKIVQHTSGQTAISLDAQFPQATNAAAACTLFQLDYDLVTNNIVIDTENNTLDFIESGTTVLTATITAGTYTPAALATAVAAALNAATTHGNSYSASYDSNQRLFTVTSNLGGSGSPIFTIKATSANYYRSGWSKELGFDYTDQTGAGTYTGNYPLSAIVRLTQAARIFYGGSSFFYGQPIGQVGLMDPVAFDREYPLVDIKVGTPTTFCVMREKDDGTLSVRFNRYPMATTSVQGMRVEFDHVPYPKDLQNNTTSIPLVPRRFRRVLTYGSSYFLLKDKSDFQKAQAVLMDAQQALKGLIKTNRKELEKAGRDFGNVVARPDLMPEKRHFRLNTYGYDGSE